jgi:hypothetical protein
MDRQGQHTTTAAPSVDEKENTKKRRVSFIFLCKNGVKRVREMEGNKGGHRAHSMGGRTMDYFGAHSTTHPNQPQLESTGTRSSSIIHHTRNGQRATAVIFIGEQRGKAAIA